MRIYPQHECPMSYHLLTACLNLVNILLRMKSCKCGEHMPKQSSVPDEMTKPIWDACNEGRLIMQACKACDYLQYHPEPECFERTSSEHLESREMSCRG